MCFCLSKCFLPNPHAVSGAPWGLESSWLSTWAEVCGLCCQGQARDTLMAARGLTEGAATTLPCSSPASLSCLCLIMANAWMNHLSLRDFWWRCLMKDKHFCTIPNGSFFLQLGTVIHMRLLSWVFRHTGMALFGGHVQSLQLQFPPQCSSHSIFLMSHVFVFFRHVLLWICWHPEPLALTNSSQGWCDDPRNIPSPKCDDERAKKSSCHHAGTNSEALQWCHPASVMAPVLPA